MNLKTLGVIGAVLLAASSAMADLKSDTQKQFDRYCAAVKKKDGSGIEKVLRANFSPDFEFVTKKGEKVGLTKWIGDEKMMVTVTQVVKSVSLHIDSMKLGKGTASMGVTLSYEGIAKMDPKGKPGLLKFVATTDQTMVRKNGKWWVTVVKEGTSKSTFNGKPVGM